MGILSASRGNVSVVGGILCDLVQGGVGWVVLSLVRDDKSAGSLEDYNGPSW